MDQEHAVEIENFEDELDRAGPFVPRTRLHEILSRFASNQKTSLHSFASGVLAAREVEATL